MDQHPVLTLVHYEDARLTGSQHGRGRVSLGCEIDRSNDSIFGKIGDGGGVVQGWRSPSASLVVRRHGAVLELQLSRPERLNALDHDLVAALEKLFVGAHDAPDVRALLLTGAGPAFCAGSDISDMLLRPRRHGLRREERTAARSRERARLAWAFANVVRLYELPIPTVAALHGAVAGAGLALALACDVRIAAASTRLVTAYGRLGLPGDWGLTWLLPQTTGLTVARRMLLRGYEPAVDELVALGLADEITATADADERALEVARGLAEGPTLAFGAMKRLLASEGLRDRIAAEIQATLHCQETHDHNEGLDAFAAKRTPQFRGQ